MWPVTAVAMQDAMTKAAQGLMVGGVDYTPPRVVPLKRGLRTSKIIVVDKNGTKAERPCPKQKSKWGGWLPHTCGSGPAKNARIKGTTLEFEIHKVYSSKGMGFAHDVAMPDGSLIQCADDTIVAPHCGVDGWQRTMMLKSAGGAWRAEVSDAGERLWDARWPGVYSPQYLYPTASANHWFLGLEHAQLDQIDPATGTKFTDAQYRAAAWRAVFWERKHGFRVERTFDGRTGYATHEDVDPFDRWSKGDDGLPWDPGVMRPKPTYDEPRLFRWIEFWRGAPDAAFL